MWALDGTGLGEDGMVFDIEPAARGGIEGFDGDVFLGLESATESVLIRCLLLAGGLDIDTALEQLQLALPNQESKAPLKGGTRGQPFPTPGPGALG